MSTNNPSYQSLIDRITAFRKSASDTSAASMPDSVQDKSNPEVPMDPEAKKKKLGMPEEKGNDKHQHGKAEGVEQSEVTPATPENVAADNNNFDKVATNISDIAARAAALLNPPQQATAEPVAKQATADQAQTLDQAIELSPEFHFKLASAILETEEGINMAESILMRHKGQMEAQQLIKDAMVAHNEFVKAAAAQQEYAEYEQALLAQAQQEEAVKSAAIQEIIENTTEADQAQIVKIATAHKSASAGMGEDEAAAYGAGAGDAEGMMQHEESESPEKEQGEEGPASMEELLHVLGMLVQSGEIDEQTAQQVAQELMAAEGGQGGDAEMAPEEAAGMQAAKSASALLAHFGA